MATQEKTWNVANRLHSQKDSDNPEVNHIIAGADEIYDDTKGAKQSDINAQTDAALADRYTKDETYNQQELNSLITTPDVSHVSVVATSGTTAVTDVLPATGTADTIYRIGNWDGTQYDPTVYSLYAWNGTAYVCLAVRSLVGEVYDISVNHPDGQGNPTPYADLAAALGTYGANVPESLRKGGMSVKFIQGSVQSADNKYVQYRLTADTFTTDITKWQNMGDFVEEKEHPIADNDVAGYLTDKNKSVIAKLMKNGAVEWLVKNSDITSLETAISNEQTRAEGAEGNLLDALNELDANSIKEVSANTQEENVSSYLTDKDSKILLRIMEDGAIERTAKNSTDRHLDNIDNFLSDVSSEVPDSGNGVIKYLTDKDGRIIATINNVGDTEFKGGGGFDGEVTKSRSITLDAVKVLTDNKGSVVGWITPKGEVHIEILDVTELNVQGNTDLGLPEQLFPILGFIANGTENHKFISDKTLRLLQNIHGKYSKEGTSIQTEPVVSIQDDDALDCQLPQSYNSSATSSTQPSSSYQNRGGFASLLWPVLNSLNKKHASVINGKITCGVATEGQRTGLTSLYGMTDDFDGHLNTCGEMVKALVEKDGWECLIHGMTCRYISNSYLVEGLDSEFAQSLLVDATYSETNGLGWPTTTCYDTVTKKNYKVKPDKSGWDECPLHYAKPYLALTKASASPLIINPTYSFEYQVKTWKDRAETAHLPYSNILVVWGSSHGSWHVIEDMKYVDAVLAVGGVTSVNTVPFRVCPNRNPLTVDASSNGIVEHTDYYNVYNKNDYDKLIGIINECIETGGWSILRGHAYEAMYRNEYRSYFTDYGEQHLNLYGADAAGCGPLCYYDTNYPSEWIQPLKYAELMDMIGDNVNDYWNNPPARLNIQSWADWYPCPGTTMAMIYDVLEYAINKGVRFDKAENVLKERGNLFAIGCETFGTLAPDTRLPENQQYHSFCRIGSDGSVVYNSK